MSEKTPSYDGYFGIPAIGDPGRAAGELQAGRPLPHDSGADHEISAHSISGVEIRAASVRGLMHRYRGEPRQDRFSVVYDEGSGRLLTAVCDGVGEFGMSHRAAAFVAERMPAAYLQQGRWSTALAEVNLELAAVANDAAKSAPDGADPGAYGMRTTFVGAAISIGEKSNAVSIAWTDDSSVWLLEDDEWTQLTESTAGAQGAIHRTSVRALPHEDPRFRTIDVSVERGALFLMTDGVGVPLESAAEVREVLSGWWSSPPDPFTFARQVGFGRKSHLDDRTVVGIWFAQESARHR